MVTTAVSRWRAGSGATTWYPQIVGPWPSHSRRVLPLACTSVLVRNPTTSPRRISAPAAGSCETTTAVPIWESCSVATPSRPAVRITLVARARVCPMALGTRTPPTMVEVGISRTGISRTVPAVTRAEVGVEGWWALGMVGSSRPATTSTASPATRAAAVAVLLDDTRMLPPACMATVDLTIAAEPLVARRFTDIT
jgi:hypothetical protein